MEIGARKWAALAAAGVVAVSAVAGTALTDKRDDVFHRQQLTWTSCDVGGVPLQCGEVRVPVDWSRPDGDTIPLAVSRHRATGDRRGSLLLDPGGPGGSGVDFVPGAVGGLGAELVAAYDLVGWDPRGSGRSHPLTCPPDADTAFAAVDSSPDTLDERLAYEQAASTWAPTRPWTSPGGWRATPRPRRTR